jgi:DNA polymerase I-like protein with 3'-5' exonuclease and polymerase domains
MKDKTDGLVNWTEQEAKDNYNNFFKQFSKVKENMIKTRFVIEELPKKAGESLSMFKNGKPYAISTSVMGRTRRFCLKPYMRSLPDRILAKSWIEIDSEGNKRANIYSQEISSTSREAFNFRIQGTAADVLKKAALMIGLRFIEAGLGDDEGIIALVHDEVMVHVKQEHAELASRIMVDSMVEAGKMFMERVPLDVDIATGDSWYGAKP